ncbi:hypothetical protein ACS0TY_019434 [Phlomoides rotata]
MGALTDPRKKNKKLEHVDPLEKALADSRKKNKKLDHVDQSTLEEKASTDSRKSSITEQVSKKCHVDPLEKALPDSRKRSLTEQVSKNKKLDHVDPLEKALADSRKKNKKLDQSTLEEKALTDSRKRQVSKKGHVDPLEKALADSRKRSLTEKVSKNKKLDHVDLQSTLETDSRKSSITHAQLKVEKSSQPLQCKNWVTGNCVHGDKCKYLHSWFCGSGFTMLAKLEGHTEAVTGISLPSGSNKLYSVGKDRTVRVWDCSSGQCTDSAVTDCEVGCLVSEGPWLFLGLQNAVKAWNVENNMGFSLNAPCGLVCSVVVEDDTLIAGMEDGSILVWKQHPETKIHEPAAMVREHNGSVCSLVIGANRLFSGSKDCTIKVWDLQNMQCLHTLTGHTNAVKSVLCWDCYLLSASLDNTLKVGIMFTLISSNVGL